MKRKNKNTKKRSKYTFIGGFNLNCSCHPTSTTSKISPCKNFMTKDGTKYNFTSTSLKRVEDLIAKGKTAKEACEEIKEKNKKEQEKKDNKYGPDNPKPKKGSKKKGKNKVKTGGYKSKKRSPTKKKKPGKPMLVIF